LNGISYREIVELSKEPVCGQICWDVLRLWDHKRLSVDKFLRVTSGTRVKVNNVNRRYDQYPKDQAVA
jgi:hypothetical protein